MKGLYYDREGNDVGFEGWAPLANQGTDYARIADHTVTKTDGERFRVSTIWTGINIGVGPIRREGEPDIELPTKIFETKVFCDDEEHPLHLAERRYSTEAQARQGHQDGVDFLMRRFKGATLVDRVATRVNLAKEPKC